MQSHTFVLRCVLVLVITLAMLPRVLQRAHHNRNRTRVLTFNCRTLLADVRLQELDYALTEKGILICALQETRRDGFKSETTENYEFFWYGECSGHRGVGFVIHKSIRHLVSSPRGIPDSDGRLLTIDILLHDKKRPVTFICAYAPTSKSSCATRKKFYSQLDKLLTPYTWLLGDFNARVGRRLPESDSNFGAAIQNTVGPYSLKGDIVPNTNGEFLINSTSPKNLRHVASHFRMRDSKRWTWRHPRYRSRTVLDHVFTPASHMRFVSRCFVPSDFAVSSDHRPVICELNFRPRTSSKVPREPLLDMRGFAQPNVRETFQNTVTHALGDTNPDEVPSDQLSSTIRNVTCEAARATIPTKSKSKFPEEFSPETIALIQQKRTVWRSMQNSGTRVTRSLSNSHRILCQQTKRSIRKDRNALLEKEAAELTSAFRENTFKGYSLLKQQHRSRTKTMLPPESDFTAHYRSHYQLGPEDPLEVAGCDLPPSTSDDTLTRDEFDAGVRKLNANRQAGQDGCAPEYIKHGGPLLLHWTFTLMLRIWTFVCDLPVIDRIGNLVPIAKKAGGALVTSFRPICLLTTLYKLYAILVFQKVCCRVKDFVTWTQCGFIGGRSCGNNLWILRRVAEKAVEFNTPVFCVLVDYKGAFDAINRTTLGRILALFLTPSMVRRVMSLYFDAKACVKMNNILGPEFDLLRGVRQGCPASPSFFTVALAFISKTFRLAFTGIKLIHLHLSTIEYADDQIFFSLTSAGLQEMLNFLSDTAAPFGLRLAPGKCELICFHRPGTVDKNTLPVITFENKILKWKSSVIYLGSLFAEDGNVLSAVKHRICCAETIVERLNPRVFRRRAITPLIKGNFISSAVLASLLYGLQYCAFGKRERTCVDGYFLRLAKRVLHLPHNYHLSYAEAEQRLGVSRPSLRLMQERLRWTGHVLRSDEAVLFEVLTFIPEGGARGRGRPRRRFYDTVKEDLLSKNIAIAARTQTDFWRALATRAADRKDWRHTIVN